MNICPFGVDGEHFLSPTFLSLTNGSLVVQKLPHSDPAHSLLQTAAFSPYPANVENMVSS